MKKLCMLSALLLTIHSMPSLSADIPEGCNRVGKMLKLGTSVYIASLCMDASAACLLHGGQGMVDGFTGNTRIECVTVTSPFVFRCVDKVYSNNSGGDVDNAPYIFGLGAGLGCLASAGVIYCMNQDIKDYPLKPEDQEKED